MSVERKARDLGIVAIAVFTALAALTVRGAGAGQAAQGAGQSTDWRYNDSQLARWVAHDPALDGAIDVHYHGDPDGANIVGQYLESRKGERSLLDVVDMAIIAKASGLRGFVFKQKQDQTAALAYIARKVVPGIEVFGGIGLGRVYGVNPAAVEHMAEVVGGWGRLVWMVSNDSVFEAKVQKDPKRIVVPMSRNGELLPETKAVIATIAKVRTRDSNGQLVMATGHNSGEEALMMVREGNRLGLQPHMVVTHANHDRPDMTLAQMQEAAKLGAFIEILAADLQNPDNRYYKSAVEALRTIGPDHIVFSTDVGRVGAPSSPQALATAAKALRGLGFAEPQINRMFKENPARLLGLSVPATAARDQLAPPVLGFVVRPRFERP